jgi:hypothetical protein
MFQLDRVDISGTFRIGTLVGVAPADLVRVFGMPECNSDDGKTNGEFHFTDPDDGTLLTVYAYKQRVDWSSPFPIDWSVGGFNGDAFTRFCTWIFNLTTDEV